MLNDLNIVLRLSRLISFILEHKFLHSYTNYRINMCAAVRVAVLHMEHLLFSSRSALAINILFC